MIELTTTKAFLPPKITLATKILFKHYYPVNVYVLYSECLFTRMYKFINGYYHSYTKERPFYLYRHINRFVDTYRVKIIIRNNKTSQKIDTSFDVNITRIDTLKIWVDKGDMLKYIGDILKDQTPIYINEHVRDVSLWNLEDHAEITIEVSANVVDSVPLE